MSRRKQEDWGFKEGGQVVRSSNCSNRVTFSDVVWGREGEILSSVGVWQMGLCIFHAVGNLFGWLSSGAWGPRAECVLHTTAESHDVWPPCRGKLPSKEKGRTPVRKYGTRVGGSGGEEKRMAADKSVQAWSKFSVGTWNFTTQTSKTWWSDGGCRFMQLSRKHGKENSLPGLPSFGMLPLYPVFVRACVWACVCGTLAGRLSAYKYHITTQGNAGIRPSSSRPNKYRSSSTLEVRGNAHTNGIAQKATLLSER